MSDWKDGFRKAIVDAMVASGGAAESWSHYAGGFTVPDTEARAMIAKEGIDYEETTWEDEKFSVFLDTDAGSATVEGVAIKLVLNDGTVFDWSWTGSLSDLITKVVTGA